MDNWEDELDAAVTRSLSPSVKELNKAVHRQLDGFDELDALVAAAMERRDWIPESNVLLIHEQTCCTCCSKHTWTEGWFTHDQHVRDRTATRKTKGRTPGLEDKIERVQAPEIQICANCAESQMIIDRAWQELLAVEDGSEARAVAAFLTEQEGSE